MLFKFFYQWRSITSSRFVLNMVWSHHLQLRSHPPLFHNLWQFNVKAAAGHHPIIQKEVDELLAKGVIEPSSGGASFFSSMFVVPKCTGGLQPILNWKCFKCYMHVPSFKMTTQLSDMSSSLFSMAIILSPLNYRMLIYIFLSLSSIIISYILFSTMCLISGRFYHLDWPQLHGFSQPSLSLFCSFAITRVSILLSIWMTSWFLFILSGQVRGLTHFVFLISSAWITY